MKHFVLTLLILLSGFRMMAENNARFVSQTVPSTFEPGASYNISVTFRNTGTTTWQNSNAYRLGTQSPQDNTIWMGTNRVALPYDVAPDEEVTFDITITAPTAEGIYTLQWRMVQDGVEWFGQMSEAAYFVAVSQTSDSLLTEGNHFSVSDHIVSTSFFCWYGEGDWQVNGPWIPVNGRDSWDGSVAFWERMIKEAMTANMDVFYVELIPTMEESRIRFFLALNSLRREGWNVPKVCPFLDTEITYTLLGYNANCGTEEGIDELIGHYIRFYHQYYAANTDEYADDFIYTQDGHPVLDIWHIQNKIQNYNLLTRDDVTSRLQAAFGDEHPIFNNDIKMINNAYSPCFSFCDERIYQFEMQQYKIDKDWNGINSSLLKPGYWDQNVRYPGYFLPRDGGSHFAAGWDQVNADTSIDRVYIESFNEYDEGSGIFAARTDTVFRIATNTNMDIWSDNDDPWEYIKTTAAGAAEFNDFDSLDAKIIWNNIPAEMIAGETVTANVMVQNSGNISWANSNHIMFGQHDDDTGFGPGRYYINDEEDEIPVYGGIFRGRVKVFNVEVTAPETNGTYETHWGMLREGSGWFGETLLKNIEVSSPLGIHKNEDNIKLNIYPNPVSAHDAVTIEGVFYKNDVIVIYDITGKQIYKKVPDAYQTEIRLPVKDLKMKQGIYIIRYENKNGSTGRRLIVL